MKKTENIIIRCNPRLKKNFKALANKKGITMSDMLEKCIREELKASKADNGKNERRVLHEDISFQESRKMAGCMYHFQNILNVLERENQNCGIIRREVEAVWDLLN